MGGRGWVAHLCAGGGGGGPMYTYHSQLPLPVLDAAARPETRKSERCLPFSGVDVPAAAVLVHFPHVSAQLCRFSFSHTQKISSTHKSNTVTVAYILRIKIM